MNLAAACIETLMYLFHSKCVKVCPQVPQSSSFSFIKTFQSFDKDKATPRICSFYCWLVLVVVSLVVSLVASGVPLHVLPECKMNVHVDLNVPR